MSTNFSSDSNNLTFATYHDQPSSLTWTTSTDTNPMKITLPNAESYTISPDTCTISPDQSKWYKYPTRSIGPDTDTVSISDIYSKIFQIPSNRIEFMIKDRNAFKHIKEYVPNKVYGFTFEDGTVIKTTCCESDTFSLEYAFFLALAKKDFKEALTFEGVLAKAKEIQYSKYYSKLVKDGIKLFYKQQQEEENKKQLEEERKKHRKLKKIAKKQRQKDRKKESTINLIAEAIKRAKGEE